MISNNKKLPASSIRDLLKGGLNRDLFRGEKYVASIWVIQLGHDWKKRAGSCSFTDDLDPSISIFKDISLTSEKRSTRIWQDLVRFHQEQRRMMASHWKQQCQSKDRNFSCLNSLVKTLLMCSRSWKLFLPQSWFSRKCVSPRWVWLNIWGGTCFDFNHDYGKCVASYFRKTKHQHGHLENLVDWLAPPRHPRRYGTIESLVW